MIWLFHRHGEYLACEIRTALENAGFELLMSWSNGQELEWYPNESEVEARWRALKEQLAFDGWGELYPTAAE